MTEIIGIDVSHHQGVMDWAKAAKAGAQFAMIRAGSITALSGELYYDYKFHANADAAPQHLPVGFYWFFRPEWNALKQAEYFCNLIQGKQAKLPAVIDVEVNDKGVSPSIYGLRLKAALDYVEKRTGRTPMIYTRASVWDPWLGKPTWAERFPLWVAHYSLIRAQPYIPYTWKTWTLWQYSADRPPNMRGAEFGAQSTSIDINRFNGDAVAFAKFAGKEHKIYLPIVQNTWQTSIDAWARAQGYDGPKP